MKGGGCADSSGASSSLRLALIERFPIFPIFGGAPGVDGAKARAVLIVLDMLLRDPVTAASGCVAVVDAWPCSAAALCPAGGGAAACCFCRNRDTAGGTLPAPSRLGSKHGASAHTQSAKDISPAAGSPSPSPRRDAHVACDRSQPVCRARHSAASGSFSIRCRSAASDLGRAAGETRRK